MITVTKRKKQADDAAKEQAPEETGDAATDATDEKAAESTEEAAPRGRSAVTPLLAVMAGAVLVVAIACVALWHQHSQDEAIQQAREQGLAAAQSEAKDLLSYNYRTLDYDLQKARSEMTPGMAKSFADYWQIFRPSVEKSQTQALTQIQVAGVTDATPDHVDVLLFVKMISVNAAHKEPQVDTSWPRLQLRKVGKKWLIDGPRMTTPPPASTPSQPPAPSPHKTH